MRFSEILRSVEWKFRTDVSGQSVVPSSRIKQSKTLEAGAESWPETSLRIYHSTLRKIPEERICHWHRGGGLKSRILPKNLAGVTKEAVYLCV